jgi:hypothetical protein
MGEIHYHGVEIRFIERSAKIRHSRSAVENALGAIGPRVLWLTYDPNNESDFSLGPCAISWLPG